MDIVTYVTNYYRLTPRLTECKYHPLHPVNVLTHLLCHVTYVTAFNKCSDLVVKPAISMIFLSYEQDNPKCVRYPAAANIFKFVYINNTYQIWLLNSGDRVGQLLIYMYDNIFKTEKQALFFSIKVSKGAKIRNRYNQVPHLTQDTNGKVATPQLYTTNESQEVSLFPAGDHKAHINRHAQRYNKHKTDKSIKDPQKETNEPNEYVSTARSKTF